MLEVHARCSFPSSSLSARVDIRRLRARRSLETTADPPRPYRPADQGNQGIRQKGARPPRSHPASRENHSGRATLRRRPPDVRWCMGSPTSWRSFCASEGLFGPVRTTTLTKSMMVRRNRQSHDQCTEVGTKSPAPATGRLGMLGANLRIDFTDTL